MAGGALVLPRALLLVSPGLGLQGLRRNLASVQPPDLKPLSLLPSLPHSPNE